jgi:hypothetical protein
MTETRMDQNAAVRHLIVKRVTDEIYAGKLSGKFKGDGFEVEYKPSRRNLNKLTIYLTFKGQWPCRGFRGFDPAASLGGSPYIAKQTEGNEVSEPDPLRRESVTTIFAQVSVIKAYRGAQIRAEQKLAREKVEGVDALAAYKLAVAHARYHGFADEVGNLAITAEPLSEGPAFLFPCVRWDGKGFFVRVDRFTKAVETLKARAVDGGL